MLSFLKKKNANEFSLEAWDDHFIPYTCHYDPLTLITKNGELLQIIKIDAYLEEDFNSDKDFDIRSIIRKSILDNVSDRRFSFWFHTVRRKKNIDSFSNYQWTFAKDTHEGWAAKNHLRTKYLNEIYITILHEGVNFSFQDNIALTFIPKKFKKFHSEILDRNLERLNSTVSKMMETLSKYGGRRLQMAHDRFGAHSELLEFLSKLICLKTKRIAAPIQDISKIFSKTRIAYGGNSLEIVDEKEKHFAAVYSIKEYHEYPSIALDGLLRVASEYIISQTINFVDTKEARKEFDYFDYILSTVSKDEESRSYCGLESLLKSDKGNLTDYGSQQISFTVIGESIEELNRSIQNVNREMQKLGIVAVREDLHMALVFFSQLPGNFNCFRRSSFIDTRKTASFASLHNTPSGNTKNIWGSALTIFRRDNAAPHFFNFHINNNGNTLICGSPESSKNLLANFLITESTKYDPNILYLDQNINSRIFLSALGGRYEYVNLEGEKPNYNFNPFALKDSPENRLFLKEFLGLLIFESETYFEEDKNKISTAIDDLFTNLDAASRRISVLLDFFEDEKYKNALQKWCRPNKYGLLFDNPYDEISTGARTLGLNLSHLSGNDHEIARTALVVYSFYRAGEAFDKQPTIIVLNDANNLTQHQFFQNNLPVYLNKLVDNNALSIFICTTGKIDVNANISGSQELFPTKLFLPEINPKIYQTSLNLADDEVARIKIMKPLYRHVMIKQNNELVLVELNLDGIDYSILTLEGNKDAQAAFEKALVEGGDNPNRWITPYYRNLFPEEE